jgi:hypothetical protein
MIPIKYRKPLFFAGSVFSFIFAMNYLRNFIYAWIHGYYTGSYTHTIDINQFGEANFELVLFISAGAIVFFTTIYHMRKTANETFRLKKERKEKHPKIDYHPSS